MIGPLCLKVIVLLRTFKISSDCHKKHSSLSNAGLFWRSLLPLFRWTYARSVSFLNETSKATRVPLLRQKPTQIFGKTCRKKRLFIFCLFNEYPCSKISTISYVTVEFIGLTWLCKHTKKVRSNQASISVNSCTELYKTQFPQFL